MRNTFCVALAAMGAATLPVIAQTNNLPILVAGDGNSSNGTMASPQKGSSIGQTAAGSPRSEAGELSPLHYGVKCNGQVMPVMGLKSNGSYLGTTVVAGTDDTAAIAAWMTSLANQAKTTGGALVNPVGVSVEGSAATTYQAVASFPYAAHCLVTTFPNIPEGVTVEMNGTEIDVTTAAGNGPQFVGTSAHSGQYFVGTGSTGNGSASGRPYTNGINGRSNDTMRGGRIVYAGPIGSSTGIGLRVSTALDESFSGINIYGFHTCVSIEAVEYSHFDFNQVAYCTTGYKVTTGWVTPGGPSAPNGGVSIDNNFFGDVARLNKINYWLNGAAGNRFYAGTSSFALVADLVFGANPPDYIATIALSDAGAAVCPANTHQPITFTDSEGGVGAQGIVIVNTRGIPTAAYSTNGGMNYTSRTIATVPGCTTQPRLTPVTATTRGFGAYDGPATSGTGDNFFSRMDIESEGSDPVTGIPAGRPATGFQILLDDRSGGNLIEEMQENVGGNPQEFTRLARVLGSGNMFRRNQFENLTDPASPRVSCPIEVTTKGRNEVELPGSGGYDPANYVCFADSPKVNTSAVAVNNVSILGWEAGTVWTNYAPAPKAPAFVAYTANSEGAPFTPSFVAGVVGEAHPRIALFPSGSLQAGPGGNSGFDSFLSRSGVNAWSFNGGSFTAASATLTGLTGTGNAYACINASGQLYRSATACR